MPVPVGCFRLVCTRRDDMISAERITNGQLAVEHLAVLHVLGVQQSATGEERGRDDHRVIPSLATPASR